MSAPPARPPGDVRRAALWMIGAVVSFSAMAVAGREAMRQIGALELMLWRSALGLAVLLALHAAAGPARTSLRSARPGLQIARCSVHFGAQYAWLAALTMIPMVELFALEFTAPLWVAVLAPLLLGERLTRARAVAAAVGFVGAIVVIAPTGAGGAGAGGPGFAPGTGTLLALASALGFALHVISVRSLVRTDGPFAMLVWMNAVQLAIGAAVVLPTTGLTPLHASTFGWAALVALAGLAAHYALTRASRLADAIVVAPMDFLRVPLIALVGVALYDEALRLPVLAGAAIILVGNALNLRAGRGDTPAGSA